VVVEAKDVEDEVDEVAAVAVVDEVVADDLTSPLPNLKRTTNEQSSANRTLTILRPSTGMHQLRALLPTHPQKHTLPVVIKLMMNNCKP
jgi:hypothetical protein